MARKTKEQRALEAQQDAAFRALSREQEAKLETQIAAVKIEYEAGIEAGISVAEDQLDEIIQHESENVLAAMTLIRQEWGDDAVEGALRNFPIASIEVDLTLHPVSRVPRSITEAEEEAERVEKAAETRRAAE